MTVKHEPLQVLRTLRPDQQVDLEELLRLVVDEVTRRLDADRGTLYLLDHARSELVSRVAHLPELAEIRLRLGEGVAGWVARSGQPVRVAEGASDPRFTQRIDQLTGYQTTSLLAAPVVDPKGEVLGVLQVLNRREGTFGPADEEALGALAREVAALLQATSLRAQLHKETRQHLAFRFNHIVGESTAMREVYDRTARAARTEATVLVRGESGSGKEAIARAVHYNSPRRDGPFVKVDCAALPEALFENELFGHERGAFTGADRTVEGKVAQADGGTLFLDEVGEVPPSAQGKLLRLLQERTFTKVGATQAQKVDARFVCATHRDLEALVADGGFRQDLYYRLRVVQIDVPPLRARGAADLDRLIDHFLFELGRRHGRPDLVLAPAARAALHAHAWPGNVRELEHALESAIVLAPGQVIAPGELPIGARPAAAPAGQTVPDGAFVTGLRPLAEVERAYIEHVLAACEGNRSAASRVLQIGRNTLQRKLK
ncbi:MAG: sigma-54-dependent Fis family transcriptional regulator [Planctomycetes bacterium]|nr:sigma-54-dependent Fis family transcriptional regulator [Planctomycetota bacterium]